MRNIAFAFPILAACLSHAASSHPRLSIEAEARIEQRRLSAAPRAYAGDPAVRIRNASKGGLSPIAFADWLASHPAVAGADSVRLRKASTNTKRLNLAATRFADADSDGDGRVTARELTDYVSARPRPPRGSRTASSPITISPTSSRT